MRIDDAIGHGSHLTGSFTGSFTGDGSSIENVVTSSFAITASYAENAGGGAGFPFSGSAVIKGSLAVRNGLYQDHLLVMVLR